jgi:glycosyltransferase involved in cell wall biosynthesis
MPMMSVIRRCRIVAEDQLRYDRRFREIMARVMLLRSGVRGRHDDTELARSIALLAAGGRLASRHRTRERIRAEVHKRIEMLTPGRVDWTRFSADFDDTRISRAVLLKPKISSREKGVLFISFEHEWLKLLCHCDLTELAAGYTLVVAPSSSPCNLTNYAFAAAYPRPFYTLISNRQDLDEIPRISPKLQVVPLYASSWVDPGMFRPLPYNDRNIDIVMVANFGKVKRHHVLFSAIRRLPALFRILLIGQEQDGRTAETIIEEARCYGVEGRISILTDLPYGNVADALCRAKTSIILSKREGSCVVVAESLFADTPAGLMQGALVGSGEFINLQTGRFLTEKNLALQLSDFVAESNRYSPRNWANANISCFRSIDVLNRRLRIDAEREGEEWTTDIACVRWCPDPELVRPEDQRRLEPAQREFELRFGIKLGPIARSGNQRSVAVPANGQLPVH